LEYTQFTVLERALATVYRLDFILFDCCKLTLAFAAYWKLEYFNFILLAILSYWVC